jgi:hypothetical protein
VAGAWLAAKCGWRRPRALRHFEGPSLTAAGVGVLAGVAAYNAGPWL